MRKLLSGIIAAVVALGGWSESEAADGSSSKLMGDRGPGHSENWVLYEDLPEDAGLLSINSVADEDQPLLICQSEDGVIGNVSESTQGSAACVTREGVEDTFYVLTLGQPAGEDYEAVDEDYEDEEESGGIADALRKKQSKRMREKQGGGGMLPDFDWTEEEREEMAEALEATDAWQRFVEEGSETQGAWRWDRMMMLLKQNGMAN